jgi:WD40 repeat protein
MVEHCAVDPQGRWIVSASVDETLRVWDAETGAFLARFIVLRDWISAEHELSMTPRAIDRLLLAREEATG